MDPLSITASVITVTGLAGIVVIGSKKWIELRKAPTEVFEVLNEISDSRTTLHNLRGISDLDSDSTSLLARQQLAQHIEDASRTLLDLEKIVYYCFLESGPRPGHEKQEVNRRHWVRDRHRIAKFQEKLRLAQQKIQLDLTTVSAFQLSNLQIRLRDVTLCAERADHQSGAMLRGAQSLEQKIHQCLQVTAESRRDVGVLSTTPTPTP